MHALVELLMKVRCGPNKALEPNVTCVVAVMLVPIKARCRSIIVPFSTLLSEASTTYGIDSINGGTFET